MAVAVETSGNTEASSARQQDTKHLRVILLGGPGKGKSSLGNSFLGRECFVSGNGPESLTSECSTGSSHRYLDDEMNQQLKISVTDTPGVFDTQRDNETITQLIGQQIFEETSPGPHAFLIVCSIERYTAQEEEIIKLIRSMFGPNAVKYCIFIFTYEDKLERGETIQQWVKKSKRLGSLMQQYQNRYLSINNKNVTEEKVKELIGMIDKMVAENGNEYYSNTEYQRIEQMRQSKKKQKAQEEESKRLETEKLRQEKKAVEQELADERLRHKHAKHEDASKVQPCLKEDIYAGAKKVLSGLLDIGVHAANAYVDHHIKTPKEQAPKSSPVLSASGTRLVPSSSLVKKQLKTSPFVSTVSDSKSEQIEITAVRTTTSSVTENPTSHNYDSGTHHKLSASPSPLDRSNYHFRPPESGFIPPSVLLSEFKPPTDPLAMLNPTTRSLLDWMKISTDHKHSS